MSSTPRDQIFKVIYRTDSIKLTIADVQLEADENLSEYTIRHALNGLAEVGILKHKENSPYWYRL